MVSKYIKYVYLRASVRTDVKSPIFNADFCAALPNNKLKRTILFLKH